jgi:hypothetical protein
MKQIVCIFIKLCGLKINSHKTGVGVFFTGQAKEVEEQYKDLFCCEDRTLMLR